MKKPALLKAIQKRIAAYPGLGDARRPGERNFLVPEVRPDQFLYGRGGPWPQPSPAHPLGEAPAVMAVPPMEWTLWNATIGTRYLQTQVGYPPLAAAKAVGNLAYTTPSDAEFNKMLFTTAFTRFLNELTALDRTQFSTVLAGYPEQSPLAKYDFSAMDLIDPLEGMHCAPTKVVFSNESPETRVPIAILVGRVLVTPRDSAWDLAKIYVLQGAAYHMLFVVHPALHFPMDSINAITKTSVPYTHPLFQLLMPHTSYSLALNNAVLHSPQSVVNEHPEGTWFDPLTGRAYNLKRLFAAGYMGLSEPRYSNAYPRFDYLNIPMGFDSAYGTWLQAYFEVFLEFTTVVAEHLLAPPGKGRSTEESNFLRGYTQLWASYCAEAIYGFPDAGEILDPAVLARALAIYMWDTSVAHGADHASFGFQIPLVDKFLRIRRAPPESKDAPRVQPGEVFTGDDLYRGEMAQAMFFTPSAIKPNLHDTRYAFTDKTLFAAQQRFVDGLLAVSRSKPWFMPLTVEQAYEMYDPERTLTPEQAYALTIPQSIQY